MRDVGEGVTLDDLPEIDILIVSHDHYDHYPKYKTVSDIVEVRKIKANLVSVNVDKLVQEGLEAWAFGCFLYMEIECYCVWKFVKS